MRTHYIDQDGGWVEARTNMRSQAPDFVKDQNGDAWGTEIELGEVRLDFGGYMVFTKNGWEYTKKL
jgi:hypothetical protein